MVWPHRTSMSASRASFDQELGSFFEDRKNLSWSGAHKFHEASQSKEAK
jgi:hypothetical protein